MLPEELARVKIDKQLNDAGWNIVSRLDYLPNSTVAIMEGLMQGNTESDYLLFIEGKAIAVIEAKKESNNLGEIVAMQAENYAHTPQSWYGLWFSGLIPLVYLANGKKIYFKNMLEPDSEYEELTEFHSPKKMLKLIGKKSEFGALPRLEKKVGDKTLRDCQYDAELALEKSFKAGKKKALAILATGSGKTYLACLASYRLLNYTSTKRILFLVDRNNLARQTETEFSLFDRTEKGQSLSSLYQINRLKKSEDIDGDVIISTIQKLFAVLTGQSITEDDEDSEDELVYAKDNEKSDKPVVLGDYLKLPPDYFQFIIVDECHRSIYGKWKAVLDYFKDARILGLTATPTPEVYAYFNKNIIEEYTYGDSVVDGVNVPARVYRIKTEASVHGGTIDEGESIVEKAKRNGQTSEYEAIERIDYTNKQLDRSVVNRNQIESVVKTYRDSIYEDLYPERNKDWRYIPKTLIFAKDDHHATEIVGIVEKVFGEMFDGGNVPTGFVQKITYSAGNSNDLIRDLRTEKNFRIAVTVTLVATGTDVKPLEVVLFMNDVKSEVLYTQMKGRGCRVIQDDKLREVTPNATTKECFYIVDAVGVTETDKTLSQPGGSNSLKKKVYTLEQLLERLSHNELSDDNLSLLRDYCSTIHRRYENSLLFSRHLDKFIVDYGFAPKTLANNINVAFTKNLLPPFIDVSSDNSERLALIDCLICNLAARNKLLEMQKGYYVFTPDKPDEVIYKGFSKETARSFIATFEKYLEDNKDSIEALRIIYNSEDTVITYSMLCELQEKLQSVNKSFTPYYIWSNYKTLDSDGQVEELNVKQNVNALTHLIQIVRYAFKKNYTLTSLFGSYAQRFNLYCGQAQRELSGEQKNIMRQIAEYIVQDGAFTIQELNEFEPDLWKKAIVAFGAKTLAAEMQKLSKFILKAA